MRRSKFAVLFMALAVAGVLAVAPACGGGDDSDGNGDNGPAGDTIVIEMTDNVYTPKEIEVPVGKTIEFVAKNKGAAVHNMKILAKEKEGKDFASDALVNPGSESKFKATFTKTGKYNFQCDYHLPDMAGVITVK